MPRCKYHHVCLALEPSFADADLLSENRAQHRGGPRYGDKCEIDIVGIGDMSWTFTYARNIPSRQPEAVLQRGDHLELLPASLEAETEACRRHSTAVQMPVEAWPWPVSSRPTLQTYTIEPSTSLAAVLERQERPCLWNPKLRHARAPHRQEGSRSIAYRHRVDDPRYKSEPSLAPDIKLSWGFEQAGIWALGVPATWPVACRPRTRLCAVNGRPSSSSNISQPTNVLSLRGWTFWDARTSVSSEYDFAVRSRQRSMPGAVSLSSIDVCRPARRREDISFCPDDYRTPRQLPDVHAGPW